VKSTDAFPCRAVNRHRVEAIDFLCFEIWAGSQRKSRHAVNAIVSHWKHVFQVPPVNKILNYDRSIKIVVWMPWKKLCLSLQVGLRLDQFEGWSCPQSATQMCMCRPTRRRSEKQHAAFDQARRARRETAPLAVVQSALQFAFVMIVNGSAIQRSCKSCPF
jgi:hypothetical protein